MDKINKAVQHVFGKEYYVDKMANINGHYFICIGHTSGKPVMDNCYEIVKGGPRGVTMTPELDKKIMNNLIYSKG